MRGGEKKNKRRRKLNGLSSILKLEFFKKLEKEEKEESRLMEKKIPFPLEN